MAEAAREEAWNHTSAIRSDLHTRWLGKVVTPASLHPMLLKKKRKPPPPKPMPGGVAMLTRILCEGHDWARKGKSG